MRDYRAESFWLDTLEEELAPRAPLAGLQQADVVIVGAGYTGLWTAYYLLESEPSLRVAICEANIAGIGASGRNGGWCMGMAEGVDDLISDPETREAGLRLARALFETPDEVHRVVEREQIDCHFRKGGMLEIAILPVHRERIETLLERYSQWGFSSEDYRWLSADELMSRMQTPSGIGALYSPHVAAIQPARLVRGLARVVESRGARLFELSPVRRVERGRVETEHGVIQADWVVIATEGYTPGVSGRKRRIAPIHSMMVATEPLSPELWKSIGLADRETFGAYRRISTYGQRTADDRIAFGTRGSYFFGSAVREQFKSDDPFFQHVERSLLEFLPQLREVKITHRWGGPLGFSRNLQPRAGVDADRRLAYGGGYSGEGVGASNLVGRILSDLLLEKKTDRVQLPWVTGDFPDWEPEPFRWLGITTMIKAWTRLDRIEAAGRKPSRLMRFFDDLF